MEGGCHCGNIRFSVTGEPSWTGTCYCVDCRKISGTTSMAFAQFKKGDYKILKGKPKEYRSSEKVRRSFCENCGSPLSYHTNGSAKIELPIGIFDDPEPLESKMHIWVSQKLPWVKICDDFLQRSE